MPSIGSASLAITPDFDQSKFVKAGGAAGDKFTDGFYRDSNGRLRNAQGRFVKGFGDTGDAAGGAFGARFGARIKTLAKVGAVGLGVASVAAFKFAGDALEEAREAQKVGALTESTIKATGKAAKVTAKQVGDLSNAISKKSGIDDEAIQRGANMLLTFKNIRNEAGKGNKIFARTTKATADMAAAMAGGSGGDIDLKSASILMGKALNDPVKGLAALTRVGVQFTDQQKAINKALVEGGTLNAMAAFGTKVTAAEFAKIQKDNNATAEETVRIIMGPLSKAQEKLFKHYEEGGHTLEAQRKILKEVNSQFGGAAAAQATEADKLKVAWGNFKEEIGTQLLPVMDDLSKFLRKKGIPALERLGDWVRETGIPKFKEFAGHAQDVAGFLNDLPRSIKIGGLGALVGLVGMSKLRHGTGPLGTAGRAVGLAAPVRTFETNPAALGSGLGGAAPTSKFGKAATAASKAVLPVAIVAWSGLALKDFYTWNHGKDKGPLAALSGSRVGELSRKLFDPHGADDFKAAELEKAAAAYRGINDATKKLPNQLDQGKTAAQNLLGEILKVDRSDPKVHYTAPGFDVLLARTREYDSLLDGLNNRIVTTVMRTRYVKNDTGEGGGTIPQPPGRSGGVNVHIDRVEAHDYQDFMTQIDNRAQRNSLDGRRP